MLIIPFVQKKISLHNGQAMLTLQSMYNFYENILILLKCSNIFFWSIAFVEHFVSRERCKSLKDTLNKVDSF